MSGFAVRKLDIVSVTSLEKPNPKLTPLFKAPVFRRFFISRAISLIGDAVVPTALALSLVAREASAVWLGAMMAAAILPKVLLLALGGVAADRLPKRPLMAASSIVCGLTQIGTAAVFMAGLSLWWALACQAVFGMSMAIGYPATFGYLPHCVEPADLGAANALVGAWTGAASLLGPTVAAVSAALGPPSAALAADGASFLVSAALLAGLPRGEAGGPPQPAGAGLREGWQALRGLPWLLRMTVVDSLILLLVAAPFMVLGPGIVQHLSPNGWALLMVSFALGELLGSLACGRLRLRRPILTAALGLLAMGLPPLLLAAGAGVPALCAAQFLAGAGIAAYGVLVNTAIQQTVPADRLSRVGAISSIGSFAFLPLGYVLAPLLAGVVGPEPLLWIAAVWTLASVGALVSDRALREFGPRSPAETVRSGNEERESGEES
ncbi:MFS transporter [Streptomyces sp. NBC_00536]|uniref:MFS transporter n=1 Tax=Streptomyces sp. NBC_00536 TaxID=2975769 RepID=UPI002E81C3B7|nr:MFS transporter [Streptomyces sp. NBC_00536]WUC77113.1 MFS transporter [Streptomyces sp. NBC_00536]